MSTRIDIKTTKKGRFWVVDGDIAYIDHPRGRIVIDAEDMPKVQAFSLVACFDRKGYVKLLKHNKGQVKTSRLLHRIIVDVPEGLQIDHKDNNKSNNRKSNLRLATNTQNQQNRPVQKNNTTGFKGVTEDSKGRIKGRWKAKIGYNNRKFVVGRFNTAHEAAQGYDFAARRLFGAFACSNGTDENVIPVETRHKLFNRVQTIKQSA